MVAMQIDIVSDTVCPWCYIGKRRLETALAARPRVEPDLRWRPFQLAPDLPPEGIARDSYLAAKFGSTDAAKPLFDRIAEEGRSEGIAFAFNRISRAPNSFDSHRLIRWAASSGCQDAVVEALFEAFFCAGEDIADRDLLVEIAGRCGMDSALVRRLFEEDRDRDLVRAEAEAARRMGIGGVPTFVFDRRLVVSGAQSSDILATAIDRLAASPAAVET